MQKLTKTDFKNIMTSAESVKLLACLADKDITMLETDNNTDILSVIENHTDSRLNALIDAVPDFTTGRTYKARSKDMVSSENTYLYYQNTGITKYNQYKSNDGLILNVMDCTDSYGTYKKILIYAVKAA